MKALILNSGMGTRMGVLTSEQPKCMTEIFSGETIISRQLRMLSDFGVREAVITVGYLGDVLMRYAESLDINIKLTFVENPKYRTTNYIYSIYLAEKELLYLQSVIGSKTNNVLVHVAVELALFCERLISCSTHAVLVGISQSLHYEYGICQINIAVAV